MRELVEVITKALVDDPESVVVTERAEKKTTVLEVKVYLTISSERYFCS
mgnify:CR=1 FL=1